MQHYAFTFEGKTPLLMHRDDVMAMDRLTEWRKDPKNKRQSTAGDDRSPPWGWITYLYSDPTTGLVAIDQASLMTCLRQAATAVPAPKGRGSFKALSQSGMLIGEEFCDFLVGGKRVEMADVMELANLPFSEQFERVKRLGFELSVKRARVGQAKHVRVRPLFRNWRVNGTIIVEEASITPTVITQMLEIAGRQIGLGDWRPSSKESPGQFGTFRASVKPAKEKKAG